MGKKKSKLPKGFPTREEFVSGFPKIRFFEGGGVGAQVGGKIHPIGQLSSQGQATLKAIRKMKKQ